MGIRYFVSEVVSVLIDVTGMWLPLAATATNVNRFVRLFFLEYIPESSWNGRIGLRVFNTYRIA